MPASLSSRICCLISNYSAGLLRYIRLLGGELPDSSGMRCTSLRPLSGGNYLGNSAGNTSLYSFNTYAKRFRTSGSASCKCSAAPGGRSLPWYRISVSNDLGEPADFSSWQTVTLAVNMSYPCVVTILLYTNSGCSFKLAYTYLPIYMLGTINLFPMNTVSFTWRNLSKSLAWSIGKLLSASTYGLIW